MRMSDKRRKLTGTPYPRFTLNLDQLPGDARSTVRRVAPVLVEPDVKTLEHDGGQDQR